MSPAAYLLVVAVVVYLAECLLWVPAGATALISGVRSRFRPVEGQELIGNQWGGVYFLLPLPPLGRALVLGPGTPYASDLECESAASRIRAWRRETLILRVLCNLLWVYLFVVAPVSVAVRGLVGTWIPLLIGLGALELLVSSEFYFAHRALLPEASRERIGRTFAMLLSPPACIRADDAIGREVLQATPRLVAAALLCGREALAPWARRVLYDEGLLEAEPGTARSQKLDALLALADLSLLELRASPPPSDASSRRYCPRCQAQFVEGVDVCSDCDVETRTLPAQPELAKVTDLTAGLGAGSDSEVRGEIGTSGGC